MGEPNRDTTTDRRVEPALRRFAQEAGFVEAIDDDGATHVRTRDGLCAARPAASCLLAARVGDKVLLARSEDEREAYVLAILARSTEGPSSLSVEGDLELRAHGGAVRVTADEGIELTTPQALEATAGRLRMQAEDAKLFLKSVAYLGREVAAKVRVAKLAGDMIDSAWSTVRSHADRVYRDTKEMEHVQAGSFDVRCDRALTLHANNTAVTAEQLIKMDSAQILMG